jgi:hypothetical protein
MRRGSRQARRLPSGGAATLRTSRRLLKHGYRCVVFSATAAVASLFCAAAVVPVAGMAF